MLSVILTHRLFDGGFLAAQADRQFAQHARNKLLAREHIVAVLASPGQYVGRQVHEGPTKAAAGLQCEGHKLGAARSVPLILGRFVRIPPSSAATAGHSSGHAVCGRPLVDDGNVTHTLLPLEGEQQVFTCAGKWPGPCRMWLEHSEPRLLGGGQTPPAQRTAHNIHDFHHGAARAVHGGQGM
jgi:hypothetical protein